ncbi:hypothetical protein CI109_102505 [Kwoniella shandongensis]|uniref:Uncharacterized protein n=1 Tax=Kwoniella shandongensis TaxID=1734106 RepID=A0A5M6C517_9TREE|nr:uncharacterized protein CI109_003177 [Kwoniella shandongensis]KAA5528279.1 hypothetical protein CI109_003177 [Kwoniella shandongensis]
MSEYQNIVIVGASAAGHDLANTLVPDLPGTHRILLVDALEYAWWPVSNLRSAITPGWEKKGVAILSDETVFPSGSQHRVIAPNKVIKLNENSIVLEKPFEGSTEVPFFKCILATGASQPTPMRPSLSSTKDEWVQALVKIQQDIAKAKRVVIIGAGAVGVEVAGEIRVNHPSTSVTIVHSEPHVLHVTATAPSTEGKVASWSSPPTHPKLSANLEKILKTMNVDLIFSDKVVIPTSENTPSSEDDWSGKFGLQDGLKKVKLASGKTIEADYVFISIGNKPNVQLVKDVDVGALNSGLVSVDKYLKIISTNTASPLIKNYYAIGDCNDHPGWKTLMHAQYDAKGAAVNVLKEIKGKPLVKYNRPVLSAMFIPLGPDRGAGSLTVPYTGTWQMPEIMVKTAKSKNLFVDDLFLSRFKGPKKATLV